MAKVFAVSSNQVIVMGVEKKHVSVLQEIDKEMERWIYICLGSQWGVALTGFFLFSYHSSHALFHFAHIFHKGREVNELACGLMIQTKVFSFNS